MPEKGSEGAFKYFPAYVASATTPSHEQAVMTQACCVMPSDGFTWKMVT